MTTLKKLVKKIILGTLVLSAIAVVGVSLFGAIGASAQNGIEVLGSKVCNDGISAGQCAFIQPGVASKGGVAAFILSIARFITYIAGAIAVVIIVIAGVQRMNISDAEAAKTSDKNITNAAIGLAIAILAYTIVGVLSVFLVGNFFGN
jgi:Type IV secretion system pilin